MSYIHEQFNYLPVRAEKVTPMTKTAITIDLEDLETLMIEYVREAWDGEELVMPLTLSGLLQWLKNRQKEITNGQATTATNN